MPAPCLNERPQTHENLYCLPSPSESESRSPSSHTASPFVPRGPSALPNSLCEGFDDFDLRRKWACGPVNSTSSLTIYH